MSPTRCWASLVAVVCVVVAFASPARAQVASAPTGAQAAPGWNFSVTPYAWLPTVSTTYSYTGPRGSTVTNTISSGIGDYLSELNFALMLGAEARYDRFTLMTHLVYANASITTSDSHFSTEDPGAEASLGSKR